MRGAKTGHDVEVAAGVYRFGSRRINWYVVEDDGELTVVDAGLPGHWEVLLEGIDTLGYGLDDVSALVLTHGHSDHIGFAEQLREEGGVPIFVHEADAAMTKGDGGGAPMGKFVKNVWRPAVIGLLTEITRGGGLSTPPATAVETFENGAVLDVPGKPRVVHVPGHSDGSCAFHLPDRDVLICGDALATVDIITGKSHGPQLMSLFSGDETNADRSLDAIESFGHVTLLPGHGDPWTGEMTEAVRLAHERGL